MRTFILLIGAVAVLQSTYASVCEERKLFGNACKSCTERVLCINTDPGKDSWTEFGLKKCDIGYICDQQTGDCVKSDATCYDPIKKPKFECVTEGIYPDPYDCKDYHICTEQRTIASRTMQHILVTCAHGIYSTRTQSCSVCASGDMCIKPVCKHPGQRKTWPDDNNMYYICIPNSKQELFATLLRCPENEMFDGTQCVRGSLTTTVITSTTSSTGTKWTDPITPWITDPFTSTPTPTTFVPTMAYTSDFTCTSRGIKPHPTNCRKYYYCDNNLLASEFDCEKDTYFDTQYKLCLQGTC